MILTVPQPAILDDEAILARGTEVLQIESEALQSLRHSLDETFVNACKTILAAKGRVVVTGMGKSGHIGRKAAATFSATGTPASYVHPAEAAHGDLGMLVAGDALIVISNSGNTSELQAFLTYARTIGVPVIGVASRPGSLVMRHSDVQLCIPAAREACNANIAPTTSTTLQLALCDALAMTVMDMRGFSREGMKVLHPGGAIGLRLLSVSAMMHTGSSMPLIGADTSMADVLSVMTSRGFGIAGVVGDGDDGELNGVITDGDLRRNFERLQRCCARDVMTPSPKTLDCDMSAEAALKILSDQQITAAFVHEPGKNRPIGIVHIHDFVRVGLN